MAKINEEMLTQAIKTRNTDQTIAALFGGIATITLPKTKPSDIVVGKKFWDFDHEQNKWVLITITYVRSGVVFYTKGRSKKEDDFPLESLMTYRLEPEYFVSDYNPQYYNVVSRSGKTKITYSEKN